MTNDNQDALRCANAIEGGYYGHCPQAAAHLRRLVRENEALEADNASLRRINDAQDIKLAEQDALLRQAVEALDRIDGWLKVRHMGGLMPDEKGIQAAIRQHLEGLHA